MSSHDIVNETYRDLAALSTAPADKFADERNRRFRRLLEHHVHGARNSAYANLWRLHGLDPRRDVAIDLAEVERLPLVDRRFLKEAGYARRPAVPDNQIANRVATSGTTTGDPLTFPVSFATRRRVYPTLLLRCFAMIGAGDVLLEHSYHIAHRSVAAHFTPDDITTGTSMLFGDLRTLLGNRVVVGDTRAPLEEHLWVFNRHRPRYSCTSPHAYLNILAAAEERGIDLSHSSLEYFLGGGAPLLGNDYARLTQGLGLRRAAMTYVSNETGLMGAQPLDQGSYTIFDDEYLVEVVDDHGRHVAPGERGDVAVTSFAADAVPLIRYLIGDTATYLGRDGAFPNATAIADISRSVGAIIGDAKISFEEIMRMPHEMTLRGVAVFAVQLARRKAADRRDQLIMRVEAPRGDVDRVKEVALTILRLNHQIDHWLNGGELPPPIIEIYPPGVLSAGQFKVRPFIDESHLAPTDGWAVPVDQQKAS